MNKFASFKLVFNPHDKGVDTILPLRWAAIVLELLWTDKFVFLDKQEAKKELTEQRVQTCYMLSEPSTRFQKGNQFGGSKILQKSEGDVACRLDTGSRVKGEGAAQLHPSVNALKILLRRIILRSDTEKGGVRQCRMHYYRETAAADFFPSSRVSRKHIKLTNPCDQRVINVRPPNSKEDNQRTNWPIVALMLMRYWCHPVMAV
ncbi:hypothetical protein BDN70DRAFT_901979 [Pholiota conissans]|uniref:Uncharacterized protein n=1 Tax=Pholiota conissans TaxID=109636 RepID=A0A9P5YL52_9AGAR|nr:hypothetical protein BDN70DRAFT_901979 [Pholiota conissans]